MAESEALSPLDDWRFLSASKGFVRGVDSLVPLLRHAVGRVDAGAPDAGRLLAVTALLDGLASGIAGELVARGEVLKIRPPPTPALIAEAFAPSGDQDDHDALGLCGDWCRAIDDVLYFYGDLGLNRKPSRQLAAAFQDDDDALMVASMYVASGVVCDALKGLKTAMLARLGMASDREYLNEAKKPVMRLPRLKKVAGG